MITTTDLADHGEALLAADRSCGAVSGAGTSAALLQLMWLASPALPVGGYSYSEGLEAAIHAGHVLDEATTGHWLTNQLQLSLARSEMPLVAQAHAAWLRHDLDRICTLNTWVTATREASETRQQTQQMGRSMVEWLKNRGLQDDRIAMLGALMPTPTWPVAFALAAAQSGASAHDALLSFGFGWAENMVQAALKSVPLGQNAGQRVLSTLTDRLPAAVTQALTLDDESRQAHAPMLAILAAQHESQYSRLFRS